MKKLLLLVVVSMAVQIQSFAAISVDQTTHPAVLQNNGYSAQTTDMVNVLIILQMKLITKIKINS